MSCNLDMAVFIDKNRYVWGFEEDLAIAMVESHEGIFGILAVLVLINKMWLQICYVTYKIRTLYYRRS